MIVEIKCKENVAKAAKIVHLEENHVPQKRKISYILRSSYSPFAGKLRADNRWVKTKNIPWDIIEDRYAKHFSQ